MHAAAAFESHWRTALEDQGPDLLPHCLSRAAADTLGADGAGLSLISGPLRVPIAATDQAVTVAEQAQATQGSGPCIEAVEFEMVVVASAGRLAHRWPQLADAFTATPFRSTVSVPIALNRDLRAALDLYFCDAVPGDRVNAVDSTAVGLLIAAALLECLTGPVREGDRIEAALLANPLAQRRVQVWTAVGMISAAAEVGEHDALARLRAHAYGTETTIDDLAEAVASHRTGLGAFLDET